MIHFCIVTFATLGYGDIQPIYRWSQAVAGFESLTGAFFIALFVTVFARKYMR